MGLVTKMEVVTEIKALVNKGHLTTDQALMVMEIQEEEEQLKDEEKDAIADTMEALLKENPNLELSPREACKRANVRPITANINYARNKKRQLLIEFKSDGKGASA